MPTYNELVTPTDKQKIELAKRYPDYDKAANEAMFKPGFGIKGDAPMNVPHKTLAKMGARCMACGKPKTQCSC